MFVVQSVNESTVSQNILKAGQYQHSMPSKSEPNYSSENVSSLISLIPVSFLQKQQTKRCCHFYVDTILEDVPSNLLRL